MPGDWPQMKLSEAGVELLDCLHKTPASTDDGYPYVTIPQMHDGRLNIDAARRISSADYVEWTLKAAPKSHDVVLSRRCNPGETAYVEPGAEFALGQNLVLLRADGLHLAPRFLRWLTRSPAWWEQIGKFLNVGAVFDSLKCADIPNFTLPIPPLGEQERISDILGALDDKIELSRRMNRTLAAMARAIFQAWFVNFEPVKAKAHGAASFSGMPQAVFDGLSTTLVESELGRMPDGWQLVPIGDLVGVIGGGTPSTKEPLFWEGGVHPFCTPRDMSKLTSPVLLDTDRHITDAGVEKISSGQLPVGVVLLSSRAPIGYLAIAETPVSVNQGIIAMQAGDISNIYILLWTEASMEAIKSRAGGSTFAEISKRNFRPIPALRPTDEVLAAFDDLVRPLYERVVSNLRESIHLTAIRDALLPALVSGKIRACQ